ncbi:MAG TPA: hypothetical protein VFW07_01470 [Parafilimonas sp.]|nr:hypothetical protein [Parafilimonas sp.]
MTITAYLDENGHLIANNKPGFLPAKYRVAMAYYIKNNRQTMLRTYLLLAVLFTTLSVQAQTYKDDVKTQFLEYTNLLLEKDFEKSTDYLNPAFFKIIPKDQLVKLMEQTYNNPEIDFEIEQPIILTIKDKIKIDGSDYVKFQYSNYLKMRFKSEDGERNDTTLTKNALEKQFGHENVTYDAETDFYKILVYKDVIANSLDDKKWTFLVVEDKQKPMLEKILPKGLL